MNQLRRIRALVFLLLALVISSATLQSAQASSSWVTGLYNGWVYFMAKADYQYSMSMEEMSIQFQGARFYESHGNLECVVFDEAGTGHCNASFPMDIVDGASGSFQMKNCSGSTRVSSRASAVDPGVSLPPLQNSPLGQGFSMSFDPRVGPENGTIQVSASCPGGGFSSFQDPAGEPQWPSLDFYVEYASALSFGGSCSMEGLPKSISVGAGSSTLSLSQCTWRVLYIDPEARLP